MGMAIATDHFTVSELSQFDGQNGRHELLDGALLVTPLGSSRHQSICLALGAVLREYVRRSKIGAVFSPGRVIVDDRNALEPDVLVVPGPHGIDSVPWEAHPAPLLAVEVLSPSTRSFDLLQKRIAYLRRGAAEYWVVDPDARTVTVFRARSPESVVTTVLPWAPVGSAEPLTIDVRGLFER